MKIENLTMEQLAKIKKIIDDPLSFAISVVLLSITDEQFKELKDEFERRKESRVK